MVSGFACFSGLQQFDFFCFCRTEIHCFWQEVEAKPQWCGILFSADQFLYSFGGFTRNLREAFCFTTEYYKKDWKCILSSDFCCYGENKQWGQQTMNTWWFISMHIHAPFICETKRMRPTTETSIQGPFGRIFLVLQQHFQVILFQTVSQVL